VVAQFYLQRLPRAGWSVPQGAPPAAATSFTISGTKGSSPSERVCVVEYSGYTLHIFYGTIPG
jgi:hypothetical protein